MCAEIRQRPRARNDALATRLQRFAHHGPVLSIAFTLSLAFSLLIVPYAALAATHTVAPDGSGDFPTIQAAVDAAADGDIIELTPGVFTGAGNRDLDYGGKNLTVRSRDDDPETCILDCQGSPSEPHRGFLFQTGETVAAVLRGITIENGFGPVHAPVGCRMGGAVLCCGYAGPTIENCIFRNCGGEYGGGVTYRYGEVNLSQCRFEGNYAIAQHGGGMWLSHCTGTVTGCIFLGNYVTGFQGGGAGVYDSEVTFESCLFQENHAASSGGGLSSLYDASVELSNCTFAGNVSDDSYGGGLAIAYRGAATLTKCTLVGNATPHGYGAGLSLETNAYAVLYNTLVAHNVEGQALFMPPSGAYVYLSCCDLFGNEQGDWSGPIADQFGLDGNISEDPLLCGDQNPGAPYTLETGSPCLPFSPPNEECDQIGAWGEGCGLMEVPAEAHTQPGWVLRCHPSGGGATVCWRLPQSTHGGGHSDAAAGAAAELAIFDLGGRKIRTLWHGIPEVGTRETHWDGRTETGQPVGSGVYFARLSLHGEAQSSPILIVR